MTFKVLRDKFLSEDGLVHIERNSGTAAVRAEAACGRGFSGRAVQWTSDETRVTCLGCLAEEEAESPPRA